MTESEADVLAKDIRDAMVSCMQLALKGQSDRPRLWRRVAYANDIQTLWHLRTDMMAFLSERCGETLARQQMSEITEKFRGAIPDNQMPRKTRLNS